MSHSIIEESIAHVDGITELFDQAAQTMNDIWRLADALIDDFDSGDELPDPDFIYSVLVDIRSLAEG